MKKHLIWKITFVAIFIAAILALVSAPALAAGKAKNKDKEDLEASVDQILASGPPIEKDPAGYYYKIVPGNGKWLVKEFKNGHPINNSDWKYCGPDPCQPPYAF